MSHSIHLLLARMLLATSLILVGIVGKVHAAPADIALPTDLNTLRDKPIPSISNPELPAVPKQFGSVGSSIGGGMSSAPGLQLHSHIGRAFVGNAPDFLFGDVIPPPSVDTAGNALTQDESLAYWRAEPIRPGEAVKINNVFETPLGVGHIEDYYYSKHVKRVVASHSGQIDILWRTRVPVDTNNSFETLKKSYKISSSTAHPVRRVFWTEGRLTGPHVTVPKGIIQEVNVIYNSVIPETVPEDEAVLEQDDQNAQRTLWFDDSQSVLRAINREGRVLVEFLGNVTDRADQSREWIGMEVVDVIQESIPAEVVTYLGDPIVPKPDGLTTDSEADELVPSQVNVATIGQQFTSRHTVDSQEVFYATRENLEPLRVQFYWMEPGLKDILWPSYLNSYRILWPDDLADYGAHYVRPTDTADSLATSATLPVENSPQLVYQDDPDNKESVLDASQRLIVDLSLGDDEVNRSLISFTSGNDFWYLRVYSSTENLLGDSDSQNGIDLQESVSVGERLRKPHAADSVAAYLETAHGTAYDITAYIDPFSEGIEAAEKGAIIPVNALPNNNRLRAWWFTKSNPPAGLAAIFKPVYIPSIVVDYTLSYPESTKPIVLASNEGTNDLPPLQASGSIYVQNNPIAHGYNPNEEHAKMIAGRAYALRDDLNVADVCSQPYVLVRYTGDDGRPAMRPFEVLREDEVHTFSYPAVAGTLLQAPFPLPFMAKPLLANGQSKNEEVLVVDTPPNGAILTEQPHYDRFTYEDRKGNKWVYRGPHDTSDRDDSTLGVRYYYKTEEGFAFPNNTDGANHAPELGTIVPYLRPVDDDGNPVGDPITGTPLTVEFTPRWPDQVPVLKFGETLTLPKFGLPQVRGERSLQVIYEGSRAFEASPRSVTLHDPTRSKRYFLSTEPGALDRVPFSIATEQSRGNTFFPGLPTHLQERVFVDPLQGAHGALVLEGKFVEEISGEDYLLLNLLSDEELQLLRDLCDGQDDRKVAWDNAVASLETTVQRFIENPSVRGTYIVDPNGDHQTFGSQEIAALTSPPARPFVPSDAPLGFYDEAVDSYALTAVGGGSGYVTLLAGNGKAFTPEGEPVAIHIIRVGDSLYQGELKPIVAANPLSENVTVQHTGDFAGQPNRFEFQWRKAEPVDGSAPDVYRFNHKSLLASEHTFDAKRNPQVETLEGNDDLNLEITEEETPQVTWTDIGTLTLPDDVIVNGTADEDTLSLTTTVDAGTLLASTESLHDVFVGLPTPEHESVIVLINDQLVVTLGSDNNNSSPTGDVPSEIVSLMGNLTVYAIEAAHFKRSGSNTLEVQYESLAPVDAPSRLEIRLAATVREDLTGSGYDAVTTGSVPGKNRHLVAGSGVDALVDNFYVMRYRPLEGHELYPTGGFSASEGWSEWTSPALVEGWIKRVLAGINPFGQRFSDFFDNAVSTDISLLTQAGTRWEGDIALNLANVQDAGLIAIYETVLNRGINLSINGTPAVDNGPANDTLLLAAGYLADLYSVLGNEAFADAANPTILYDADSVNSVSDSSIAGTFEEIFRSTATSRFAFQGQVSTLLDEELALLRGRDDSLDPSVTVSPYYNRLPWNYTRGIDAGEVIYALNYNISEKDGDDADGRVDATDAARLFPQGHGDAYGHYLTALTNYYRLLTNEHFTWTPRSEVVNILGQPVSVDYLDERKFASAAASLAQTAQEIQDLEHRKAFENKKDDGWSHFSPEPKENTSTGRTRHWGFDDWSSRGGQGAYFHWIVANALVPHEDTEHEGIQKIDRSTVSELDELAAFGAVVQERFRAADLRLNPLDLTDDSVVFDISPSELSAGKSHFEQIYERAVQALGNAHAHFDEATSSSSLLRAIDDQDHQLNDAVVDQERAFTTTLHAIYGRPYAGDIGPGKTYPEGYDGPDLYRYMYIDRPYEIFSKEVLHGTTDTTTFRALIPEDEFVESLKSFDDGLDFAEVSNRGEVTQAALNERVNTKVQITYAFSNGVYQLIDTSALGQQFGKRGQLGSLQRALADVRIAEEKLYDGLWGMDLALDDFETKLAFLVDEVDNYQDTRRNRVGLAAGSASLSALKLAFKAVRFNIQDAEEYADNIAKSVVEGFPEVTGFSSDVTSAARSSVLLSVAGQIGFASSSERLLNGLEFAAEKALDTATRIVEAVIIARHDKEYYQSKALEVREKYFKALEAFREVDALNIARLRALEHYRSEFSHGEVVLLRREQFRKRAAVAVQGYRTRDVAFRTFRTEALEQYDAQFDLAARYAFLAAQAYDYETGLLGSASGRQFLGKLMGTRSLGLVDDSGQPRFTTGGSGDSGLAGSLAQLKADWDVAKGRLGINNPDRYGTTFSLRQELARIPKTSETDDQWQTTLSQYVSRNLLADADVASHALQIDTQSGAPLSGFIIPFTTSIESGVNFFGLPLAAGDHSFSESNLGTKVQSVGVVFEGYKGMDPCLVCTSSGADGPDTSSHAEALAATPYVYLLPVGEDRFQTTSGARQWQVLDHALPLPYDIGSTLGGGLDAGFLTPRKHQAFRAVGTAEVFFFQDSSDYTNSRLVGRSATNSKWKLIIPAAALLNDPDEGLRRFINSVTDIQIHMRTYSHAGN